MGINYRDSINLRNTPRSFHDLSVTGYKFVSPGLLSKGIDGLNHFFDERFLITLKNPVVNLSNGSLFLIDTATDHLKLIEESVVGLPSLRLIEEESRNDKIRVLNSGKVKIGITSRNYFHAVIEQVPRILRSDNETPVLLGPNGSWLGHEIYGKSALIYAPGKELVQVDEAEFISSGFDSGFMHPEDLTILRNFQKSMFTNNQVDRPTKVYISRLNSRRSPVNEDDVIELFKNFGFTVIEPSSQTLVEQMSYFANISHIAGISGAGLVNGLWGKKPKMLEIMPFDRLNRCFEFMCSISGQKYESFIFPSHKFRIDLMKLETRLSNFVLPTS